MTVLLRKSVPLFFLVMLTLGSIYVEIFQTYNLMCVHYPQKELFERDILH